MFCEKCLAFWVDSSALVNKLGFVKGLGALRGGTDDSLLRAWSSILEESRGGAGKRGGFHGFCKL